MTQSVAIRAESEKFGNWKCRIRSYAKRLILFCSQLLPLNIVRLLFETCTEILHQRGPDFITRRCQPKRGTTIVSPVNKPLVANNSDQIGFVIQGPLRLNDNFTLETVRHYLSLPNCKKVIVSTWDTEDANTLGKIRELGAEVVLSRTPSVSGRSNVNKQIVSSREGIMRAIDLGCLHVVKTRSDQRINSLYALSSLPVLLELYPREGSKSKTQKRLIAVSFSTYKWSPLFLCDMFMFGLAEDMLDYWNAPLDDQEFHWHNFFDKFNRATVTARQYIKCSPENYLLQAYLDKIKESFEFSNLCWWKILAKHFIIVDWDWLDVYWPKYWPHAEKVELVNNGKVLYQSLFHADWLNLYMANRNGFQIEPAIEPADCLLNDID